MVDVHALGCFLPAFAPRLVADSLQSYEASGSIKPPGKNRFASQSSGFAREGDENGLGNIASQLRITGLPERSRVNQIDIARDDGCECFLRTFARICRQQFPIIHITPT